METDQVEENSVERQNVFRCNICEESFKDRNELMKHMKTKHINSIQPCEKYRQGRCKRNSDDCWYPHVELPGKVSNPHQQVFQQASPTPLPPDQMSRMFWMINNLMRKVDGMEKRFDGMEKRFEEIMI